MTKRERALIKAALTWFSADHTPTTHANHDNYGEGELYEELQNAVMAVMAERDHGIEHYFTPPSKYTP